MERVKRRWWTWSVSALAVVIVLGALISAGFQFAVLAVPGYREQISDYVSRVAGRPIDIGGVNLGWQGLAPRLDLTDITLYADDGESPALSAQRLSLGFGVGRLISGDVMPRRLELSGLQLAIQIDEQGGITVRGLDSGGGPRRDKADWLKDLSRFDRLRLSDCELLVDDARLDGGPERFQLLRAQFDRDGAGAQARAELQLPADVGSKATLRADIVGDLTRTETWQGYWQANIDDFAGTPWLRRLLRPGAELGFSGADLRFAGELAQGEVSVARLQLRADAVRGQYGSEHAELGKLALEVEATRQANGWLAQIGRLDLNGVLGAWPRSSGRLRYLKIEGGYELEADTSFLRLQDISPWLVLAAREPDNATLDRLSGVGGEVRSLVLRLRRAEGASSYSARADLAGLSVAPKGDDPGFSGLSGEFSTSETGGRLKLTEAPFELGFAHAFEHPLTFDRLGGELEWTRGSDGWQLQMPRLAWQIAGSVGDGNLKLLLPQDAGRSPELELNAQFTAGDVTLLKRWIPRAWGQHTGPWLQRAIVAGRVTQGNLKIQGALRDFPFVDKPGLFALDLDVAGGTLAYAPDWPAVENVGARLSFRGNGLSIHADSGTLAGNRVERATATIADFHEKLLVIDGEVRGDAARYYEFLRASPIAARLSGLLARTDGAGPAQVAVHLEMPLADVHHSRVSGKVHAEGAELSIHGLEEPIRAINGTVAFGDNGLTAQGLKGQFFEVPITAALTPLGGNSSRLDAQFDYAPDAAGAGASSLVPSFLRPHLSGSSRWQAGMTIGGSGSGVLRLQSDLVGTAVDLPVPLYKNAQTPAPLALDLSGSEAWPLEIVADYRERLGADLRFGAGKAGLRRGLLHFGGGARPVAQQDGLYVTGSVADLDAAAWGSAVRSAISGAGNGGSPVAVQRIDLLAERLWLLGGQALQNVQLALTPAAAGWNARLSGSGGEGQLFWPADAATGTVRGRFTRLALSHPTVAAANVEVTPAQAPLEPGAMPLVDLVSDDLRLGEARLGRVTFTTARIDGGQKLAALSTGGGELKLSAVGAWRRQRALSSAELNFDLDSAAIGPALQGLGYTPNLEAQRSQFKGKLAWAPAAGGLVWAQARGDIDLELEKGSLRAVEPGAGRVLGLLNFTALPRRLFLDFRDVTSKGLSFDRVTGRFTLADGVAKTDNVEIAGPSVKMTMRGSVGLAARDYNQYVTVYPDVSSGVTLGALLLGGPAAGIIALIAQEVLDGPASKLSQFSYTVTGSWDNPQVQRVGESGSAPR